MAALHMRAIPPQSQLVNQTERQKEGEKNKKGERDISDGGPRQVFFGINK